MFGEQNLSRTTQNTLSPDPGIPLNQVQPRGSESEDRDEEDNDYYIACIASVSVAQKRRTVILAFCPREKWTESKIGRRGVGEGKEGNACGQTP